MNGKRFSTHLLTILAVVGLIAWSFFPFSRGQASPTVLPVDPVTVITVDSSTDPDDSDSRTCLTHTPCTLRRAVIQARLLAPALKPVLIQFDIPTSDPGYNASLQIWKIQFIYFSSSSNAVLRYLNGSTIIDGSTQLNGRADGPKIILVGPGTGQKDCIKLGETPTQNSNEIRGLGFQNCTTHIYVNSNSNIIADNWFGLSDDGSEPYLRNDNPEDGSGSTGVALSDGVDNNIIQDNVFLGFDGVAAALRGEDTIFQDNYIGTPGNGIITAKQTDPSLICTPVDWLGGGGISMDGPRHLVQNNIFAGMRQEIFTGSTQPDAITPQSTCDDCVIQDNKIGLDAANHEIGVCGQGIDISNGEGIIAQDNTLVETYHTAIFLNGALFDANTLRGNIVRRSTPWMFPEGNSKTDGAIVRYSALPNAYEFFNPAKVTSIQGTTVSGTAGDGNPCPNCTIELFLDDDDGIEEALQSLGVVTADASGNWTATIPAPLAPGQGIRTTSTSAQYNTIPLMGAGTTAGLSVLYVGIQKIYLPLVKR